MEGIFVRLSSGKQELLLHFCIWASSSSTFTSKGSILPIWIVHTKTCAVLTQITGANNSFGCGSGKGVQMIHSVPCEINFCFSSFVYMTFWPFVDSFLSSSSSPDKVEWVIAPSPKNGTWNAVRIHYLSVSWHTLIWFSKCIPRHGFILWMLLG